MLACFTAGVLLAIALMPHIAGGMVAGDGDGDGYTTPADCNDTNAEVHPGAIEVAANRSTRTATAGSPMPTMTASTRRPTATTPSPKSDRAHRSSRAT